MPHHYIPLDFKVKAVLLVKPPTHSWILVALVRRNVFDSRERTSESIGNWYFEPDGDDRPDLEACLSGWNVR